MGRIQVFLAARPSGSCSMNGAGSLAGPPQARPRGKGGLADHPSASGTFAGGKLAVDVL